MSGKGWLRGNNLLCVKQPLTLPRLACQQAWHARREGDPALLVVWGHTDV
ncbi:hypothetical protein [Photorhabdus sp. SF281]